MHVLWGNMLTQETQTVSQTSLSSVMINKNITRFYYPGNGVQFVQGIRNETEMHRQYAAIWLLVPVASIFITAIVFLLMVMFNRCPQMIAAVVTGILGTLIVFIILMSLNQKPIYS